MSRPRLPDVAHVPPTAHEIETGLSVRCSKCDLDWSSAFADRRLGLCVNHVRELYRDEYRKRRSGGRMYTEYGLDPIEAQRVFDAQRGACAICERPFSKAKKRNADHCHATGHFRGFLCGGCNTAIGLLHDDPAWIDRAAAYLRHHSSRLASLPPRKRVPPLRLLDIPGLAVIDEKGYPRSLLAVSWGNSGDGLQPTVDVEQTRANVVAWFAGKPLSEETRRRLEDPAPMTQEDLAVLLSRIVDAKMKE